MFWDEHRIYPQKRYALAVLIMIIAEYDTSKQRGLLSRIDENFPVFFQKPYWTSVRDRRLGRFIFLFSDCGSVCAPVLLFHTRLMRMAQFQYPPVCDGKRMAPSAEREFLTSCVEYLKRLLSRHRIIQSQTHCVFAAAPEGASACGFGTYVLDLKSKSEEELFAGLHTDIRRGIRQARERKITVEFGSKALDDCFCVISKTLERSNMHYLSRDALQVIHDALAPADQLLCAAAYHQGKPMAAIVAPLTRTRAFYLDGGSSDDMAVPGANKLLHWETIRLLLHKGVEQYDFVGARLSDVRGTKLEHIQRFKSRFGGRLEQGYLWKMDLNKPVCRLCDMLRALRRRLTGEPTPRPDIIEQELQKLADRIPGSGNGGGS
jgi:hypothetical protein